jgi:NAD(P)-dependent dehydrogenase (short-subunit alcohol dehydrogenase family)
MPDMTGKVAIVTGASSGIGRATARCFAERGALVFASDVDRNGGEETVAVIRAAGGRATFFACDISDAEQVAAMVNGAVSEFGRLDYACNNAGIEGSQALTHECTEENWARVIDTNLRGSWLCMKQEIPCLLRAGGGAIVNVSSIAGLIGFANIAPYTASKHGINGLTKCAAIEYARQNIRVNAVCPGAIQTPMIDRFAGASGPAREGLIEHHPMGRMGRPEEIAQCIVWLCSNDASFITGQTLAADGGYVAQ